MFSNSGAGEGSLRSLGLQGDEHSQSQKKSTLYIPWKDWCLSWSSNTLATWCEETTDWKRSWCWERLQAGGEEDDRGWEAGASVPSLVVWLWAHRIWTGYHVFLCALRLLFLFYLSWFFPAWSLSRHSAQTLMMSFLFCFPNASLQFF